MKIQQFKTTAINNFAINIQIIVHIVKSQFKVTSDALKIRFNVKIKLFIYSIDF